MKALSYSELYTWRKDKDLYHKRYILGEYDEPTPEMELGTLVHKALENDSYPWLKEMTDKKYSYGTVKAVRKIMDKATSLRGTGDSEVGLRAETPDGTALIAIIDRFDKHNRTLSEYKTTKNGYRWNQHSVDVNLQLSFYAYIYHLLFHSYFTEMRLYQLNVATGLVKTFKTIRSKSDLETVGRLIQHAVEEMKAQGVWDKRLTKQERLNQHQLKTNL